MAVCVDASFVGALLLEEELSLRAQLLRDRWISAGEEFVAPTLLVPEVASTLRKAVYTRRISATDGLEGLSVFAAMSITYHEMPPYSEDAWHWGETLNTPRLYDMYCLALADSLDRDVWIVEKKLMNIVGTRSSRVRWVGDVQADANQ